jgi:GNAT superfamily N-acetyltransferase
LVKVKFNRLYISARALDLENRPYSDLKIGVSPRSVMRAAKLYGALPTGNAPDVKVNWPTTFDEQHDKAASNFRCRFYFNLNSETEIKACLCSGDFPVLASFRIYQQFMTAKNGVIEFPSFDESYLPENHSVPIFRLDDKNQYFTFLNDWGPAWGDGGSGYLPYGYIDKYRTDISAWYGFGAPLSLYIHGATRIASTYSKYYRLITGFWCPSGRTIYIIEIFENLNEPERAWATCFDNGDWLEVEEFFVSLHHRRRGYARNLLESLQFLARDRGRKIRIHVALIDCITLGQNVHDIAYNLGFYVSDPLVYWSGKTLLPIA